MKKIIFVNIIVIFCLIIICEILIRSFNIAGLQGSDKNFFFSENDVILVKPNSLFKVAGKKVKTDNNGFRIPIKNYKFDENKDSILVLGDSVSFGFGVREKETFMGALRDKINFNLLNSSVIGHNLESYIYLLTKYQKETNKKIVNAVIFICLNDIHLSQGVILDNVQKKYNKNFEPNKFIKILKNKFFIDINLFLREKSVLFVFLKSIGTNSVKRHYDYMYTSYNNQQLIDKYYKNIIQIKEYSEKKGLKISFVLLPYAYQINNNCKKQLMMPQNKIKKIFKKANLELNDLSDDFCNNENKKKFFLGFDPVHLSKAGHKFVSKLLIERNIIN